MDEILEGERKVTSGSQAGRETTRTTVRRNTPGSTPFGARTKVEPRSQTSGYVGSAYAEDQCNAAEGRVAPDEVPQRHGASAR